MIIAAMVLFIAGIIFLSIGILAKNYLKKTASEWIQSSGTITAYNVEDYSSRVVPLIRFKDGEKEVMASGSSIPISKKLPSGSVIQIEYRKNEFKNGNTTYQVIPIIDGELQDNSALGIIMLKGVGILLILIGGIVTAISFLQTGI